jgi:hypothetical protein
MLMRRASRTVRTALVGLTVLVILGLTAVAYQASAAEGSDADLELTAGPSRQISAFGSSITVRYTFFIRNAGPDDLTSYQVRVDADQAGNQITISDGDGKQGHICRAKPTCDATITADFPALTGQAFQVELSLKPRTPYTVTVDPGGEDTDTRDNAVRGSQLLPMTDLVLASASVEKVFENGTTVGMAYGYTLRNSGPAPLTEINFTVDTDQTSEIRISAPAGPGGTVCRAVRTCGFRLTGQVYAPGTDLPVTITVYAHGGTRATVRVSPQWSGDPRPGNNTNSVTLPLATGT